MSGLSVVQDACEPDGDLGDQRVFSVDGIQPVHPGASELVRAVTSGAPERFVLIELADRERVRVAPSGVDGGVVWMAFCVLRARGGTRGGRGSGSAAVYRPTGGRGALARGGRGGG